MSIETPFPRCISITLLLALLFLLALTTAVHAQLDGRTTGMTYVVAFPDTTTNTRDNRFQDKLDEHVYIFIYSAVDTKVTITGNGYNQTVGPVAGKFKVLDLMNVTQKAPQPIVTDVGQISNGAFRLEAQDPIIVYCFMVTRFGSEAFTPIPVESWGTKYYAAGIRGEIGKDISPAGEFNYNAVSKMFPCEITIVAAFDNTVVSMTPAGKLLDTTWKTTVTLQANQTYQLQSYVDTAHPEAVQPEFAGTLIQSSRPIGVISGNTRAQAEDIQAGLGKNIYKNMMMEWVAPVDQHGREFVYLPTLDGWQITGQPTEKPEEKRPEEWVRVYGTNAQGKQTGGSWLDPANGAAANFTIPPPGKGGYHEDLIAVPAAVYYRTDSAAQAFMNTVAAVKFLGTTGFGSNIGAKYDGVGTFMTEMIPRERWVNFAPYYGAVAPSNMNHYVSVVTDTNSAKKIVFGTKLGQPTGPFNFKTRIKGTNLIWGYQTVNTGLDFYITGWDYAKNQQDTSVRFGGDVRGTRTGHEEYRPGATRKKDEGDPSIASGGTGGDQVLHPSEYEEYLSVAYGYPLASSHIILRPGDSLKIDTSMDCTTLSIHLKALNDSAVGLRSLALERVKNAKLVVTNPVNPKDIIGRSEASFYVTPIDPLQDASATIVITDRTGKTWRLAYTYVAERVDLSPTGKNGDDLYFGILTLDSTAIQRITITNPLPREISIKDLKFVKGTQGFRVLSPTIPPTIILKPGKSMDVQVAITPTIQNRLYEDTLRVIMGCTEVRIKVTGETAYSILSTTDIDFGFVTQGDSATGELRICNTGRGVITFSNPNGDSVITGFGPEFSMSRAAMDSLKAAQLGPGECITLTVTFSGRVPGAYQTELHIWAKSNGGSNAALLRGVIREKPAGVFAPSMAGYSLRQNDPNPSDGSTSIRYSLGSRGHATLEVFNTLGQRVSTLFDGEEEGGEHQARWDAVGMGSGIYYYRLTAGSWSQTRMMVVR
jgi:hypothetical protein